MSTEQLERMSQDSIENIPIDSGLSDTLRMLQYLEQIQNPYNFLCNGTPIHLSFVNENQELSKVLVDYFRTLK